LLPFSLPFQAAPPNPGGLATGSWQRASVDRNHFVARRQKLPRLAAQAVGRQNFRVRSFSIYRFLLIKNKCDSISKQFNINVEIIFIQSYYVLGLNSRESISHYYLQF
jgi:hypothetical protein